MRALFRALHPLFSTEKRSRELTKRLLPVCRAIRKLMINFSAGAKSPTQCAGINRHEAGNARVLRERSSEPLGPEFCVAYREVRGEA
jgi:hypothetical protein